MWFTLVDGMELVSLQLHKQAAVLVLLRVTENPSRTGDRESLAAAVTGVGVPGGV